MEVANGKRSGAERRVGVGRAVALGRVVIFIFIFIFFAVRALCPPPGSRRSAGSGGGHLGVSSLPRWLSRSLPPSRSLSLSLKEAAPGDLHSGARSRGARRLSITPAAPAPSP